MDVFGKRKKVSDAYLYCGTAIGCRFSQADVEGFSEERNRKRQKRLSKSLVIKV